MSNFEIITPDPIYGSNANFDENGKIIRDFQEDISLSSEEKICFSCPLKTCVEEAKEGCVFELRAADKRIEVYLKQLEKNTITAAGKRKLATLQKQSTSGWDKFKEGVANKLGATIINVKNV